jgi:hypothetical protein
MPEMFLCHTSDIAHFKGQTYCKIFERDLICCSQDFKTIWVKLGLPVLCCWIAKFNSHSAWVINFGPGFYF